MEATGREAEGVALPQPGPAAKAVLDARIPEFGSARNPVDITAQVLNDPESLRACAECALRRSGLMARWCCRMAMPMTSPPRASALLGELAAQHGKAAAVVWLTEWLEGPGAKAAEANPQVGRVPLHGPLLRGAGGLAGAGRRGVRPVQARRRGVRHRTLRRRAGRGDAAGSTTLTESEEAVLATYGVPVVGEQVRSANADAAVVAAMALSYPVVLKVEFAGRPPHKTEAADTASACPRDAAAVREGYVAVVANAARAGAGTRINGVLVQPKSCRRASRSSSARGAKVGVGPMVVVGLGGIFVGVCGTVSTALAPVGEAEARAMLRRLKGHACWKASVECLPWTRMPSVEVIRRVSEFAADQRDRIAETRREPADLRRRPHPRGGVG